MIPSAYIFMVFVVLVVHHGAEHVPRTDHIATDKVRIHNGAALYIGGQCINNRLILGRLCIEVPDSNQIVIRIKRHQLTDILHETTAAGAIILAALAEDWVRAGREAIEVQIIQLVLIGIRDKQRILNLHHLVKVVLQQCAKFLKVRHIFSPL